MSITTTATAPLAILCGHCKNYHPSIAAVRACATSGTQINVVRPEAPLANTGPLATAKQLNFLRVLCEERGTTLEHETDVRALTIGGASQLIGELKARPKGTVPGVATLMQAATTAPTAPAALPDVPAGRYAIEADGVVKFYRVDRPTEGRWAGRTFVKVQASDDLHPVRGEGARQVLEAIAVDPREASLRYGREIGACGVCGRTLTDETSRANGIGPICASKAGW